MDISSIISLIVGSIIGSIMPVLPGEDARGGHHGITVVEKSRGISCSLRQARHVCIRAKKGSTPPRHIVAVEKSRGISCLLRQAKTGEARSHMC